MEQGHLGKRSLLPDVDVLTNTKRKAPLDLQPISLLVNVASSSLYMHDACLFARTHM